MSWIVIGDLVGLVEVWFELFWVICVCVDVV